MKADSMTEVTRTAIRNSKLSTIITRTFHELLNLYGAQGWWPLSDCNGYHPGNYELPQTREQRFEICVGAILTQNTNWKSVEIALGNLNRIQSLSPESLLNLDDEILKTAIRTAGYFNQKSRYLKTLAEFFRDKDESVTPSREELLQLRGIGEESADSMMLYAFKQPWFVVDAYTRRIFSHLGVVDMKERYSSIQQKFHKALEPRYTGDERIRIYQEYHALIVEHAKHHFSGKRRVPFQPRRI
jgi:endonuclease-3 related protein